MGGVGMIVSCPDDEKICQKFGQDKDFEEVRIQLLFAWCDSPVLNSSFLFALFPVFEARGHRDRVDCDTEEVPRRDEDQGG